MNKKKITIILGHPLKDSFNGFLADVYEKSAKTSGHEVRRHNLGELQFDPILRKGYKEIQSCEPDLCRLQEDIKWCNHLVIVYPTWWGNMPALLKGMFDRMWLPGFAYNFRKDGLGWKRHLKGRSSRIITTSDSNPLLARILFGNNTNSLKKGILWFSGFSPVRVLKVGPVRGMTEERAKKWAKRIGRLGSLAN